MTHEQGNSFWFIHITNGYSSDSDMKQLKFAKVAHTVYESWNAVLDNVLNEIVFLRCNQEL